MDIKLRTMVEDDLEQVNEVNRSAFAGLEKKEHLYNLGARLRILDNWRMYLADNDAGNYVAEHNGKIAGYCFTHQWGATGWIGPLGVEPEYQGKHVGRDLLLIAVDSLCKRRVTTLGLEAIPQSSSNIAFYLKSGFQSGMLTCSLIRFNRQTLSEEEFNTGLTCIDYRKVSDGERTLLLEESWEIMNAISPGLDFLSEMEKTAFFHFGTTLFFKDNTRMPGFAILHDHPYFHGEKLSVVRIKALILRPGTPAPILDDVLNWIEKYAQNARCEVVQIGVNCRHWLWLNHLLLNGFRVELTNVRMTYPGYEENIPEEYPCFTRWVG